MKGAGTGRWERSPPCAQVAQSLNDFFPLLAQSQHHAGLGWRLPLANDFLTSQMAIFTIVLMQEQTLAISEFKAKCLRPLEEVAAQGKTLVITKRGLSNARVTPVNPTAGLLRGSWRGIGRFATGMAVLPLDPRSLGNQFYPRAKLARGRPEIARQPESSSPPAL